MIQSHNHSATKGVTLVELILAMLFISTLLLAIGGLVIQVGVVFTKGMSVRAVNEAGQLISSDMQRTFNTSASGTFAYRTGTRICMGNYVYAWNSKDGTPKNSYVGGVSKPMRLVKFQGGAGDYCPSDMATAAKIPVDAEDLLSVNESNLFVQELAVNQSDVIGDASQKLYAFKLQIGTSDAIKATGCTVPESVVDDQYCSINTFEFTARAGGRL